MSTFKYIDIKSNVVEKEFSIGYPVSKNEAERTLISFIKNLSEKGVIDMKTFTKELKENIKESRNEIIEDINNVLDESSDKINEKMDKLVDKIVK